MKIQKSATATNAGGYIPEGVYRARCLGTKFTASNSSGKPMTTLDCEIIEPETLEINGKEVVVAGRKFSMFLIHNPEKTGWASQEQCLNFCRKLGIELPTDETGDIAYETDDHEEYFKGMEFDIALKAEEAVKRYGSGPKKGEPILDGEGKEISTGMRISANPDDVPENCKPKRNEEIAAQTY